MNSAPLPLPSLSAINELRIPTLEHVPKGARDAWARVVSEVLREILANPTSLDSWTKWFMLAHCVLFARRGSLRWGEVLKWVRLRIKRWRDGDLLGLWSEVLLEQSNFNRYTTKKKESSESLRSSNACRARKAMRMANTRKQLSV